MKHVVEIVLNLNMRSFLKFCDCMHIKYFLQAKLKVGRPKFHHNSNLDLPSPPNATLPRVSMLCCACNWAECRRWPPLHGDSVPYPELATAPAPAPVLVLIIVSRCVFMAWTISMVGEILIVINVFKLFLLFKVTSHASPLQPR